MFERVLVPLDGSAASRVVIDQLLPILQKAAREVVLLQVVATAGTGLDDYPGVMLSDDYKLAEEKARENVEREAAVLSTLGVNVRSKVMTGAAGHRILDAARELEVTLIAMATHGRSGPARWAFGSVAEKVLRASVTPLVLVRSFPSDEAVARQPQTRCPRHILVPIDGSEQSLQAVTSVRQLTRHCDPSVTVVHFVSDYAGKKGMQEGESYLAEARGLFRALGLRVNTELLRGDPARGIVEHGNFSVTDEPPIDFIAMSSHGRSGLSRWVLDAHREGSARCGTTGSRASRPA
jgi:nucleotide-binding universal stress UspA family protein